jgi:hypothetical protein
MSPDYAQAILDTHDILKSQMEIVHAEASQDRWWQVCNWRSRKARYEMLLDIAKQLNASSDARELQTIDTSKVKFQ